MKRKNRYVHPYVDGELVRDRELNETFVFMDKHSGFSAQTYPRRFRRANEEEKNAFRQFRTPDLP